MGSTGVSFAASWRKISPGMTSTATQDCVIAVRMAISSRRGICSGTLTISQ